jgi:hypothetical protein
LNCGRHVGIVVITHRVAFFLNNDLRELHEK